ncbi:MAG: CHASE2 domain-containing protein [Alphaproteobacteria bacterium]|nr:CHASE2 domain-containing protein [Alphaproteobacteria bacterium]
MKRHAAWLTMFVALSAVALWGGLEWLERGLMELRFRAVQRDATGQVVLVEIDEASLRQLDTWPWPRTYHAELVDRLAAAGAATIALDIDFSSHSTPAADEAFAAALARAEGRVVLPVFTAHRIAGPQALDATRPLEAFARHAALASVTVTPDSDSRVRRLSTLRPGATATLPAMAVVLDGGGRVVPAAFYIDYGIRAGTIPRIAYADVLKGHFPAGFFQGRNALVAATAVQLGDNLSTPVHVVVSGGEVIALAAESLRQGRALARTGPLPAVVLALLLMAWLAPKLGDWRLGAGFALAAGLSLCALLASIAVQAAAPLSVDAAPVLLAPWLAGLAGLMRKLERQALRLFRQRMHMQQQSLITRAIVENSFDAVIVFGHNGRVDQHNRAAAELFGTGDGGLRGLEAGELLGVTASGGRSLVDLLSGPEPPADLLEGTIIDRNRKEVPVELVLRRMALHPTSSRFERRTQPRVYHFVTARDISARRAVEAERERALKLAQAASRAKSQFLATVSHELRTPLNAIIGFAEILKNQMFGPLGHKNYPQYAEDIHDSGRHLLGLINDILDVTRVDLGELRFDPARMDLGECAAAAEHLLAAALAKKPLTLRRAIPRDLPPLIADPRLVKQILVNLLSNAIKFTPAGGRVTTAAERRADGGITLSVSDTGIGIAKEAIAGLGRPFRQLDQSDTRHFEGLGLGLAIVAGLMKMHGGTYEIESEPGIGTTVSCRFPAERTGTPARAAA